MSVNDNQINSQFQENLAMFLKREAERRYCYFECVFLCKWTLTFSILGKSLPTLGCGRRVHLNNVNHRKREGLKP